MKKEYRPSMICMFSMTFSLLKNTVRLPSAQWSSSLVGSGLRVAIFDVIVSAAIQT